jgi:recombinational DNA repair ATPase RecF
MAAFDTQFESVQLANFTAFRKLQLDLSPGLNVLTGPNATGKTHLMKVLYAASAVSAADTDLAESSSASSCRTSGASAGWSLAGRAAPSARRPSIGP